MSQPLTTRPTEPNVADATPTLWRELADGSAGAVVRAFVSLALAPLLAGLALVSSYVIASWLPSMNRGGRFSVNPDDDLIGWVLVVAALVWLAAVVWIWTRSRQAYRPIWGAALLTLSVTAATILACVLLEDALGGGGEEVMILGTVCVAAAAVVLIWVQAARRQARPRPLRDPGDGALDVRCPACNYRMVGLHESRCPECGTGYTLDELMGRQAFITRTHRQQPAQTTAPGSGNGGAGFVPNSR